MAGVQDLPPSPPSTGETEFPVTLIAPPPPVVSTPPVTVAPVNLIPFGPDATCTLDVCPLSASVLQYRPSPAASTGFIVLFALAMAVHVALGVRRRVLWFTVLMALGCLAEILGYGGRIVLFQNPFSFLGFLAQICLVTTSPVFFTAAIYIALAAAMSHHGPSSSRIPPRYLWAVFVPSDLVCLVLQAAGGAVTTVSKNTNYTGVQLTKAGLVLQVVILAAFCVIFADYMIRHLGAASSRPLARREKLFFGALGSACLLILGRCAYRIAELAEGYESPLFRNEGLFIALEGVSIVLSAYALAIGHPGFVFGEGNEAPMATPVSILARPGRDKQCAGKATEDEA